MTQQPPTPDTIKQHLCDVHHSLLCHHSSDEAARREQLKQLFDVMDSMTAFQPEEVARLITHDPSIAAIESELRHSCCTAEYELELLWARHIAHSKQPAYTLTQFPFYKDYQALVDFNLSCLQLAGKKTPARKILFVGSGPLPLSAYLLQEKTKAQVDCLDISTEAVTASHDFLNALGSPMQVMETDILMFDRLADYDAVFLAALVGGDSEQKRAIFSHLYKNMKPGALLLARTAHHLRTLYYTHIKPEDLLPFRLHAMVQPLNTIINSVIVAEKP